MVIPNLYSSFIQFKLYTHIVTSVIEMLVPVRGEHVRGLFRSAKRQVLYCLYIKMCGNWLSLQLLMRVI